MSLSLKRSTLTLFAALIFSMVLWGACAAAFAAAPEAPQTREAEAVTNTTATLAGIVNPHTEAGVSWHFEYNLGASCAGAGARATAVQGPEVTVERFAEASLAGLTPASSYTACLVVENEAEERTVGNPISFTTTALAPTLGSELLVGVGTSEARVSAAIGSEGSPTTFMVEYGTGASLSSATAAAGLGAPASPVGVLARLESLSPGTTYRFRFIATNAYGSTTGEVLTLTTATRSGESGAVLPDGRRYELVSPPDNQDVYVPFTSNLATELGHETLNSYLPFRAAADGDTVAYEGAAPASGGNGLDLPGGTGNQFLARRGANGWAAEDITPSPRGPRELIQHIEYQAFSSDLSLGVIHSTEGNKTDALVPGGSSCDGLFARSSDDGAFHALFTVDPPAGGCQGSYDQQFVGASADNSHLLFQTASGLTAQAEPTAEEGVENLYDAVAQQLHSVNVLNSGAARPNVTLGAPGTAENALQRDFDNAISADGSRIFWTDLNKEVTPEDPVGTTRLFVREHDTQPQSPLGSHGECAVPADACTVQLDTSHGPGASGGGRFWTASSDGSKVLFTDCSRLTEDSTAVAGEACEHGTESNPSLQTGNDLYEYDFDSGRLSDLTVDRGGDPLGADVQGVVAASEDASYVYFVAAGALAPGASPRSCVAAQGEGEQLRREEREELEGKAPAGRGCNLYLYHAGEPLKFIAVLAPGDNQLPSVTPNLTGTTYGDWHPDLAGRSAQVTPDGRQLVFESTRRLTGYDSIVSGRAAVEAFHYDADSGALSCVSCSPSGAPPVNVLGDEGREQLLPGGNLDQNTFLVRWISSDGTRVFFDSLQPLTPQDTDNETDVYEWESEGSGGCTQASPARSNRGCVSLLSAGSGRGASALVDASASGDDVFFTTRDKLIPTDGNENMKLYDARVAGGFPETSLACTGTGCQGVPPAPPLFATPASVTFTGVGNFPASKPPAAKRKAATPTRAERLAKALKACHAKQSRHRRAACESQARKRYGPPRKAKRASASRKASNERRTKR